MTWLDLAALAAFPALFLAALVALPVAYRRGFRAGYDARTDKLIKTHRGPRC